MSNDSVIKAMHAPIDSTGRVPVGGGQSAEYIEWTAAVVRLDEAVGPDNWEWRLSDLMAIPSGEGGYMVCKGSLTVHFPDGRAITKEQFGGCAYGQGQGGRGMDPENAAKGAGSDALKKAAQLFGIGFEFAGKRQNGGNQQSRPAPQNTNGRANPAPQGNGDSGFYCAECGDEIRGGEFRDGRTFTAQQAAGWGQNKHGRPLCGRDLKAANDAKERAAAAMDAVDF